MPYNDRNPQRSNEQRSDPRIEDFWSGYLHQGYFDGNKLRIEYVQRDNMSKLARKMSEGYKPLTTNQLRRFFGHARAIESRLLAKTASWEEMAADFQRLDVAAADAFHKSDAKIPALFHDFIKRNVASVANEQDFLKGFMPHFEALVGFGTEFFKSERNRS